MREGREVTGHVPSSRKLAENQPRKGYGSWARVLYEKHAPWMGFVRGGGKGKSYLGQCMRNDLSRSSAKHATCMGKENNWPAVLMGHDRSCY